MTKTPFHAISALKIYMKSGDNKKAATWWGRAFEKPLSHFLVREALRAGISHASVNLGHVGFAQDATHISIDISETPLTTLPVCVELLAPKRILEQFIRDQAKHLHGTTLVMVDGVHIASLHLSVVDDSIQEQPHTVEYITSGDTPLKVEHIAAEDRQDQAGGLAN